MLFFVFVAVFGWLGWTGAKPWPALAWGCAAALLLGLFTGAQTASYQAELFGIDPPYARQILGRVLPGCAVVLVSFVAGRLTKMARERLRMR